MVPTTDKCGICGEYLELVARFNGYLICDTCELEINGAAYIPPPRLVGSPIRKDGVIDAGETEN